MTTSTTSTTSKTASPLVLSDYFKTKATEAENALYTDSSDNSTLGKADFLSLLVTQLQYQDPLSPADNQQMAAQMAQFSALEQTQNMAASLESMGESIQNMVDTQAEASWTMSSSSATELMGKTVRLKQDDATVSTVGQEMTWNVTATSGSEIAILDSEDNVVRTMSLSGVTEDGESILDSNGDGTVTWDGTTDKGTKAPTGTYTLQVRNATTKTASGEAWVDAVVSGVQFDTEGPQLVAGGNTYTMSDLLAVASE